MRIFILFFFIFMYFYLTAVVTKGRDEIVEVVKSKTVDVKVTPVPV